MVTFAPTRIPEVPLAWWLWTILGVVLLVTEMATPGGLFALFFGVGAILTGGLVGLEIIETPWMQWAHFTAISLALLLALRGTLKRRLEARGKERGELVGESAVALEDIIPGAVGRAELRGTTWQARSERGPLSRGQRCRVERVEGLVLWLRPD